MSTRYTPIEVNRGEGIDVHIVHKDESDAVVDLSSATVDIYEASSSALAAALTAAAAQLEDGEGTTNWGVHVQLSPDDADLLKRGNVQWFRTRCAYPSGRDDVSPQIWINVI